MAFCVYRIKRSTDIWEDKRCLPHQHVLPLSSLGLMNFLHEPVYWIEDHYHRLTERLSKNKTNGSWDNVRDKLLLTMRYLAQFHGLFHVFPICLMWTRKKKNPAARRLSNSLSQFEQKRPVWPVLFLSLCPPVTNWTTIVCFAFLALASVVIIMIIIFWFTRTRLQID